MELGVIPLSDDQITPEIRLLASRCILGDPKSAHKYAAYSIIRERQLCAAISEIERLKSLQVQSEVG